MRRMTPLRPLGLSAVLNTGVSRSISIRLVTPGTGCIRSGSFQRTIGVSGRGGSYSIGTPGRSDRGMSRPTTGSSAWTTRCF